MEVKRSRPASPILSFDAFDAPRTGRPAMRDQSRAIGRRLYDGVIATEKAEEVDAFAEGYIQNTGWRSSTTATVATSSFTRPTPWRAFVRSRRIGRNTASEHTHRHSRWQKSPIL